MFLVALNLLVLSGCDFSAATRVDRGDTGAVDSGDAHPDDTGNGPPEDTAEDSDPDPEATDDDGDGYSELDGDCDDANDQVFPGAHDGCNQVDDDCDDEIDEDAWSEDDYEPNDDDGYSLGSLGSDPVHSIEALLHNDDDVDRFTFSFEDSGWSLFDLDVALGSIPDGATYRLVVENLDTGREYFSDYGSGTLEASISDTVFDDEGGTWQVTVDSLGGADCARRYLLTISLSG